MDIKRVLTSLIGLPLVLLIIILGTSQIINLTLMIVAIICMKEYYTVIQKICKPIKWIGYISTIIIFLTSIVSLNQMLMILLFSSPIIILSLFLHIILTEMKITFKDIVYTLMGIMYITGFITFLGLISSVENGKFILIYTIVIAWSTDVFAYLGGKKIGKKHFSKISPKKTVEGCITGTISAILFGVLYVFCLKCLNIISVSNNLYYINIAFLSMIFSIISQIGDFAASSIKRFADTKDYGNLLPGHGGMLDRIDSLIFIAPFIYMVLMLIR